VSTVQEIEAAIQLLPIAERDLLKSRFLARRCGLAALSLEDEAAHRLMKRKVTLTTAVK